MSYPANSLTDPSLAVPFEGKGLNPDQRKVTINARDGILQAVTIIGENIRSNIALDGNGKVVQTRLTSSNLSTGTYRIKTGGEFILSEDLTFNAPVGTASTRFDTPLSGFWFAGITVETAEAVVIDGAGHTLRVDPKYTASNAFGSFAVLLLGNNQFSGALFGGASGSFPDTPSYIAARKVTIKNLRIVGGGSHFGIMMNNNDDVVISNCVVEDCQVANIYGQSPQRLSIRDSVITGSTTPVTVRMEQTQLVLMRKTYAGMIAGNVPGAAAQLALLEAYVAANPARFDPALTPPQAYPSTYFGIFIVPGPTSLFAFPMNGVTSATSASFVDGFRNGAFGQNITIDNCTIADCNTLFDEIVTIGSNIPKSAVFPLSGWPLIIFGLFGGIQWKDAFTAGVFAPNEFLRSIVFIMNYVLNIPAPLPPILPANQQNIFTAILTKPVTPASTLLFNNNAAPLVSGQSDALVAKGNFAMRICAAENVSVTNVRIRNIVATQTLLPIDQTTLPGFGSLSAPHPAERSRGNDVWAISLEGCKNVHIPDSKISAINSTRGYVFGIHSAGEEYNVKMLNCEIAGMSAPNTTVTPVIDAGDVFGYPVENNLGPISAENCTITGLDGPGTVQPFFTVSTAATTVVGNQSMTIVPFTLNVTSTAGFPTNGLISVVTTDALLLRTVSYKGVTPTSFTDCVASGALSVLGGAAVTSTGRSQVNCLHY